MAVSPTANPPFSRCLQVDDDLLVGDGGPPLDQRQAAELRIIRVLRVGEPELRGAVAPDGLTLLVQEGHSEDLDVPGCAGDAGQRPYVIDDRLGNDRHDRAEPVVVAHLQLLGDHDIGHLVVEQLVEGALERVGEDEGAYNEGHAEHHCQPGQQHSSLVRLQ